ncbi:aryl-alcohol dehydrogenase-like predicted oxidoreductase [Bacillus ectoiniformans]|uniref:aldo/keto reductase n=1 Tax=Bacillus ectoiniformans TaxID=1494429 RepID=UPI00195CB1E8|nr:aldo/keto reductase [Bacillus ectoiniformans]MBM7648819.1 aryl-alcohol dehydrogenase-like predicted oxidoreductase [Bacillus ectoiniformans]
MKSYLRPLGQSELKLSPLGLGCWQFSKGQGTVGKFWPSMDDQLTNDIIATSLKGGINWFDTAEIYGGGESETAVANALYSLNASPQEARIATKWWPLMRRASSISKTIDSRLAALRGRPIDLYQIHQPLSFSSVENQMKEMAKLYEKGLIKAIGVSNFNAKSMKKAHAVLQSYGLPLASNQVKFSLLDRSIEGNHVLETARDLGISIIAYSPLEQGLLTGKFHHNPSLVEQASGMRKFQKKFSEEGLNQTRPLIDVLESLGNKYGVSASQIALNWIISYHGDTVFAIPGASKVSHAQENIGALTFQMTKDELEHISYMSWQVIRNKLAHK